MSKGFELKIGEKALVVEGVGALADRSGGRADPDLKSLIALDVVTYPPGDCSLCREGMSLVKPGSGGIG